MARRCHGKLSDWKPMGTRPVGRPRQRWQEYMIYLLTAIGLTPGGSTHLQTNNTENNTNNYRTTQIETNVEECGPCPVFASFTLAFALQLRKKHRRSKKAESQKLEGDS
jgi:hypothetical protein